MGNWTIQNEEVIQDQIDKDIAECNFLSIQVDETTDISTKEQLSDIVHLERNAKLWSISKHESSSEHSTRIKETQQMRPLAVERRPRPGKTKRDVKEAEIQIAVGIACHSAILAVDHLGELMVQHGKGSALGEMQLHRTKCSQLIKNVVSPSLKRELQKDVEGKGFAVLIDESTDVAAKKNLCICIRYFSEQEM
eukprot:gene3916-15240_t